MLSHTAWAVYLMVLNVGIANLGVLTNQSPKQLNMQPTNSLYLCAFIMSHFISYEINEMQFVSLKYKNQLILA